MPLIESAIKRARQNVVRKARLQPYKSNMKTMMKNIVDLAKSGKKEEAQKFLAQAYKSIDMAAKKKIIHRKNADRKKSLMARIVGAMK